MNDNSFLKRVYRNIFRVRTMTLVNALIGIGITPWFSGGLLKDYIGINLQLTFFAVGFIFFGLCGVPVIVNKEIDYGIFSYEGGPAVLIGIGLLLIGFLGSATMFYSILRLMFTVR